MAKLDFSDRPRLVFWETTKACPLACIHCRAEAQRHGLPGELSTDEGMRLIAELGELDRPKPVLVLTGGDCLSRPDIVGLAAYAKHCGVPVAIAPTVSPALNSRLLRQLYSQGVRHASLSLDGANASTHDGIRGIPGHFDATLAAIKLLSQLGYKVQINTAVMQRNRYELADIAALLYWHGVHIWEVFFLINVGRGSALEEISPLEAEDVCHFLVNVARYGMTVRTVEAPFFRRVRQWRKDSHDQDVIELFNLGPLYMRLDMRLKFQLGLPVSAVAPAGLATRDGNGVIFVAHDGAVYPSGFLPYNLGNIRDAGLLSIYRRHPLLQAIRGSEFSGLCGCCEFKELCGGSRARAYAHSGDPLGEDPACVRTLAAMTQTAAVAG